MVYEEARAGNDITKTGTPSPPPKNQGRREGNPFLLCRPVRRFFYSLIDFIRLPLRFFEASCNLMPGLARTFFSGSRAAREDLNKNSAPVIRDAMVNGAS